MFPVISVILASLFFLIFGLFFPGFVIFCELIFKKKKIFSSLESLLAIISAGIIYNFILFLFVLFSAWLGLLYHSAVFGVKFLLDVFFVFLFLKKRFFSQNKDYINLMNGINNIFKNKVNLFLICVSFFIAIVAIVNYPHVFTSVEIIWINNFVNFSRGEVSSLLFPITTYGSSIGYAALTYFLSFFLQGLPIVTVAAGLKILLVFLYLLLILFFSEKNKTYPNFLKITLFFICFLTPFGINGFIIVGKDSFFAVIFVFLYLYSLVGAVSEKKYMLSYLFALCAAITCVISIPYLIMVAVLYYLINYNDLRKIKLNVFFKCLILFFCFVVFMAFYSVSSSLFYSLCFMIFLLFIVAVLVRNKIVLDYFQRKNFFVITGVVLLVWLFFNMPYVVNISENLVRWNTFSYFSVNNIDIKEKIPSINVHENFNAVDYPLDGKTTFGDFLFDASEGFLPVFFMIFSLLSLFIYEKGKKDSVLMINRIFILAMLSVMAVTFLIYRVNITSAIECNLDILGLLLNAKRRFSMIAVAFTAVVFLDSLIWYVSMKFKSKKINYIFLFLCFLLIMFSYIENKHLLNMFKNKTYYSSIGGSKDKNFAFLTELFYKNQDKYKLFISLRSRSIYYNNVILYMYYLGRTSHFIKGWDQKIDALNVINFDFIQDRYLLLDNLPSIIVLPLEELSVVKNMMGLKIVKTIFLSEIQEYVVFVDKI